MEWVKLGDCFEFIRNGASIKQFGSEGLPITRIETISDRTVNKEKVGYANINYPEYSEYYLKYNDILMSHINSESHLGKVAIYKDKTGEDIIHGMNLLCLRSNKNFLADYLYYFFNSKIFKNQINKIMKKSVNQASFNITNLKNLKVLNISLSKQKNIVERFSKIETLIQTRQDQVQVLDDLVESTFMQFINNNEVRNILLDDIFDFIDGDRGKNYPKKNDLLDEGYCLFLNAKNVTLNGFKFENLEFISKERDELLRKGKIERGDIILTTRGTVGNIAYYSDDINFDNIRINSGMVILRKKTDINPTYFQQIIRSTHILKSAISGSAQPQLPIMNLKNIKVPLIDIEKQNHFAAFVEKIEKQKQILNDSLGQLTMLFDSLMQDSFDGSMSK